MEKKKKYTITVILLLVLSVIWMIGICMLIWGRQISTFTPVQMKWFVIFAVLEVLTMSAEFFFAARLSRINIPEDESEGKAAVRKNTDRRGILISALGILLALCATLLGFAIGKGLRPLLQNVMLLISVAVAFIPGVILVFAAGKAKKSGGIQRLLSFEKKRRRVPDTDEESLKTTSETMLLELNSMLIKDDMLAIVLCIFGAAAAFLAGLSCSIVSTVILLVSAMWILVAFSRIRPAQVDVAVEDCECYVSPEECPELYALAKRAQDNIEAECELRISLSYGGKVEAHQAGSICTLTIGILALDFLTESELYALILHEFSMVCSNEDNYYTVVKYYDWLLNGGNPSIVSPVSELMFGFRTLRFELEYQRYTNMARALYDVQADEAMAEFGDEISAASAILKESFISLYEREESAKDFVPYYASEIPDPDFVAGTVEKFRTALSARGADWLRLIKNEISIGVGSPTAAERIRRLGVEELSLASAAEREEYRAECCNAVKLFADTVCDTEDAEGYALMREELYLKPLELIESCMRAETPADAEDVQHENKDGNQLEADDYYSGVEILMDLGRVTEAEALCEKAIAELPGEETGDLQYIKAANMLARYDDNGVELMIKLMESDSCYEDIAKDAIIEYLCLTGNKEMLEPFLERLREEEERLTEEIKAERSDEEPRESMENELPIDIYEEAGVLKKGDILSAETLPEGMLEDIITYIRAIDDNNIEKIFLLKKTITEDFSISAFIVKLSTETSDEKGYEILHSIIGYLDKCEERHFSLFEYDEAFAVDPETIEGSLVFERPGLAETAVGEETE